MTTDAKTTEAKTTTAKPAAAKPAVAKPSVAKPSVAKTSVAKPLSAKPAVRSAPEPVRAVAAKPVKAAVAKPSAAKPSAAKPVPAPAPVVEKVTQRAKPAAPAPAPVVMPVVPPLPVVPVARAVEAIEGVAQTSLTKAQDVVTKVRQSGDVFASSLSQSGEAASKGFHTFHAALVEAMQANTDATLDYLRSIAGVKTLSEAIELQARHARARFEAATTQAKTLAAIATKTAKDTTEPVRKALDASFGRAS